MKFTIVRELIPAVEKKLASFQKKFNKFGEGVVTYTKSEPYGKKLDDDCIYFFVDIEIEGHYQIKGYEFVASLDFVDEVGKNLVKKAPGTEDIPERFATRTSCDHCKTNRPRKHTILLKNVETGEYVQVGKSCVRDYLGCDVNSFATYFSFFETLEDYIASLTKGGSFRVSRGFDVKDVLAQTIAVADERGYVSQGTIDRWYERCKDEDAVCPFEKTSSVVWHIENKTTSIGTGELLERRHEVTGSIENRVDQVIDFINAQEDNDYIRNLKILLACSYVEADNFGLVVSAVGYYLRETKKREEAAKPQVEKSDFIGNVGDKVKFTAKPTCFFSTETQYGMCYMYKFLQGKDILIWKTSKCLEDADLYVEGTIKAHNEFRGVRQTEITRCKVFTVEEAKEKGKIA